MLQAITVIAWLIANVCGSHTTLYACGSSIVELNGIYTVDESLQSDDAPVYVREDEAGELLANDFRIYRHHGYWSLSDFASWPPEVHFRCDPYRENHLFNKACAKDQQYPPLAGYLSRVSIDIQPPKFQIKPCQQVDEL